MPHLRPILVGEANPYGGDPRFALYPEPAHSAGGRLCWLILRMTVKEYISTFERVNLCPEKWSIKIARATAEALRYRADEHGAQLALFGSKVCSAFGLAFEPFRIHETDQGGRLAILPHPSGLNRLWNEPGNLDRARFTLAELFNPALRRNF